MTKMSARPIYEKKKPSKIFYSRARSPMILKLGMLHQGLKLYKDYINDDSGLTLTYFTARSIGSTIHLNGEYCYKLVI